MTERVLSPDGKFMWTGSEWIPAPPAGNQIEMKDSVIGGDVISNTTINNDPEVVTEAVIFALQKMGRRLSAGEDGAEAASTSTLWRRSASATLGDA